MTNTLELEYALKKAKITKRSFAKLLGISLQTLYNKMNNSVEFKASEILKACEILHLKNADKEKIFFARRVDL